MAFSDDMGGCRQPEHGSGVEFHSLKTQLNSLLVANLVAVVLLLLVALDDVQWQLKAVWIATFVTTWLCGYLWVAVHVGQRVGSGNSLTASRMYATGIFLSCSSWTFAPLLMQAQSSSERTAVVCVLILLASMNSHILRGYFAACAVAIGCLLLPPVLTALSPTLAIDGRLALSTAAFLGILLVLCRRDAGGSLKSVVPAGAEHKSIDALEEQLQRQRLAAERTEKALVLAEQACMERTRFLATASHDLRQPIHAISLFVAALKSEPFENHARYLVDRLDRALSGLDNLFNRLLDISRLDAGLVTPSLTVVEASTIAQTLEYRFQPLAQSKSLEFRIRYRSGLRLHTDPELLSELLGNLLANAFRFTDSGGVMLSFRKRKDEVLIQVWDTGCGIAEQQIEMVFDEFVQLDNSARDRRRGLGLGLAIVKRLAGKLGHRLEVRSQIGRGSCFSVQLPATIETAPVQPRLADETLYPELEGALVLVVDDEIDILTAMDAVLSSWGCICILARSVAEARQYVEDSPRYPDLIITDHRLENHQTCFDVAATLSVVVPFPAPMIVISGESSHTLENEVRGEGWHFMRKPVDAMFLRKAVCAAMRQTTEALRQAA